MATLSLFDVTKDGRGFVVTGTVYMLKARALETFALRYPTRHAAELQADRMTSVVVEQAEDENARFDRARHYLASRAARVPRPDPQLALF